MDNSVKHDRTKMVRRTPQIQLFFGVKSSSISDCFSLGFLTRTNMEEFESQLQKLVKKSYINQGLQNEQARKNLVKVLLNHEKLPKEGWNDQAIEMTIQEFSIMDSNNFMSNAGVGEREGRVYSALVSRRHYNLSHGIGRSGDIAEVQPKAAGSSIIYQLTNSLVRHAMEIAGLKSGMSALVLPLATGMSLSMCFMALKKQRKDAKYVIWPRIDQKSCFKSISTAGMIPLVVENIMVDGKMVTDVEAVRALLVQYGSEVLCVLCTTSCFAPRQPDSVDKIAVLCKEFDCGHVINNAYGLQCEHICKQINRAITLGRVDAVVQSTDKNFMVPVGGAVVASPSQAFIDLVSSCYPGRASMTPVLDLFITLLSMGESGYRGLLESRKQVRTVMLAGLEDLIETHGLSLLSAPLNSISTGISLDALVPEQQRRESLTFLGSMLYQRSVSGCRVVACIDEVKKVAGVDFADWGAHMAHYPHSYFTVACSIGITENDVVLFLQRLDKVLIKFKKQYATSDLKGSGKTMSSSAPVDACN